MNICTAPSGVVGQFAQTHPIVFAGVFLAVLFALFHFYIVSEPKLPALQFPFITEEGGE